MHLSSPEEYGLRCLVQVARAPGPAPLTIHQIAEAEGLSPEYAAKLMRLLRQRRFVASTRGAAGGYRLCRPAGEIQVWEILQALGGPVFSEEFCDTHPGQLSTCVHTGDCSIRPLWRAIEGALGRLLRTVSLADLCGQEDDSQRVIQRSEERLNRQLPGVL